MHPNAYAFAESYPCADYKPGEDDLQNFDFIRKFELDVNLDGYPGVSRVRGSNRMQTAYRIEAVANLVMPTQSVRTSFASRILNQGVAPTQTYVLNAPIIADNSSHAAIVHLCILEHSISSIT
jgi:hypothetical protein